MSSNIASFHKKSVSKVKTIRGTRLSVQNAQLITSSGVPSLDFVVGGGLPVGTLTLIEEDTYGHYARLLVKYFMAEGVLCGHNILVASQDQSPQKLVSELPAPADGDAPPEVAKPDEEMTIAWRYQNMQAVSSPVVPHFGHYYDLSKTMGQELLGSAQFSYWSFNKEPQNCEGFENPAYRDLLDRVRQQITAGGFSVSDTAEKHSILRVAVVSLGSPLWRSSTTDLPLFFYCLRAVLRSSYAVCMVTVPSHLLQEQFVVKRCEHLSDIAVKLESFVGTDREVNPVFKDYHGLFHLHKLPAINTLVSHMPESFDLAFKLRRKKFLIEKLHLPPELQETTEREQDDLAASVGCGAGRGSALDF